MATQGFNYDTESEDLAQRQRIADAMLNGSLSPLEAQSVGGMAAPISPLSVLAKMLQGYGASKERDKIKTDKSDLATRYQEALTSGMDQYQKTSEGYSAPSMALQPGADGVPQQVQIPGDPRKAVMDALASGHPILQKLAMEQLTAQQKGGITAKDLLPYAEPSAIPGMVGGNVGGFKPKRDIKTLGEQFWDVSGEKPSVVGGVQYAQPATIGGDLYQAQTGTGKITKLDNAPKITTNVGVSPIIQGQKAGMTEYFKGAAAQVQALGERARGATDLKQTLSEMQNLDAQGIFSNATSGPATFLSNLGQVAGVKVDPTKLGNTEAYNALSIDLWQGLVSKFGGNRGVTAQEATEIKRMLPLASSSPQARKTLFGLLNNVADRQITQYKNANASFAKAALSEDPTQFSEGFGETYVPAPNTPDPVTSPGKPNKRLSWGDLK